MVIAALAWNITSWFAMMMHRKQDRRDYLRMEFRRFLTSIILVPRPGRPPRPRRHRRADRLHPGLDRLFSAWRTTGRIRILGRTIEMIESKTPTGDQAHLR
jgi:hypothetical protein